MAWDNLESMLAYGGNKFFGLPENVTAEDLNNVDKLEITSVKPVRSMTEYIQQIEYASNGDLQAYFTYSIFPGNHVDNIPLLNVYGQQVYNNLTAQGELLK